MVVRARGLPAAAVVVLLSWAWLWAGQALSPRGGSQAKAKRAGTQTGSSATAKVLLAARADYVGDVACANCHAESVASYHRTAHFLTSQVANKQSVKGTFAPGTNTMTTTNPNLSFEMDAKGNGYFETAIFTDPLQATGARTRTERLDLVIGSGGKGQSYLFWKDDELFQLPVGYSTVLHKWINGPGYVDGTAKFDRTVIPRCLECHATYFASEVPGPDFNLYDRRNYVLGISCERCHGPGRRHVESQGKKVDGAAAEPSIVNPAKLNAARKSDLCIQCHGGQGERELLPAFSYVPGQPLEKYIDLGAADPAADVDVHGKQGKLLAKSKCFQSSTDMTCSTCHNVHKPEPDLAAMSQHCLSCHQTKATPTHLAAGNSITSNCIDCHMPTLESKVVNLDVDGKKVKQRFRTHWIRIYTESERQ
ncbi:MAG TPA: multiheme c-type cytochrome [Candidatus Saccharimonadales bacterium]|nr:multiheme c-type cytochrome [Candidatus Saccharimonadales bacterium]